MTLTEILSQLEKQSDKKTLAHNTKIGVGKNQYGVKLGDIRKLAKQIKSNHKLALELWNTQNFDAQMLATLLMKPKQFSAEELDKLVCSIEYERVADWVNAYIVKVHPDNEALRQKWMTAKNTMAARAGWDLTSQRVVKHAEMLNIPNLLHRIENEMLSAAPEVQWTMNFALAQIGINHPSHRDRAIAIGEKLGIYRDYPVSKGCTSPYAPIWINAMVERQQ